MLEKFWTRRLMSEEERNCRIDNKEARERTPAVERLVDAANENWRRSRHNAVITAQ